MKWRVPAPTTSAPKPASTLLNKRTGNKRTGNKRTGNERMGNERTRAPKGRITPVE